MLYGDTFRLWAISDAHVGTDIQHGRKSLSEAILHSENGGDDVVNGRSHIESRFGVNFANISALTKYHGNTCMPMSRLFTFRKGSDVVEVKCYLHTSDHASQGWYAPAKRCLKMRYPFYF